MAKAGRSKHQPESTGPPRNPSASQGPAGPSLRAQALSHCFQLCSKAEAVQPWGSPTLCLNGADLSRRGPRETSAQHQFLLPFTLAQGRRWVQHGLSKVHPAFHHMGTSKEDTSTEKSIPQTSLTRNPVQMRLDKETSGPYHHQETLAVLLGTIAPKEADHQQNGTNDNEEVAHIHNLNDGRGEPSKYVHK